MIWHLSVIDHFIMKYFYFRYLWHAVYMSIATKAKRIVDLIMAILKQQAFAAESSC